MSARSEPAPSATAASTGTGVGAVARLAWPAILSFVLNNAYRINDQYWVQWLGPDAQAAIGASVYVLVLNFACFFLASGGALPLVARAFGAGDEARRDRLVRHALLLAGGIAITLGAIGWFASPHVARLLAPTDSGPEVAALSNDYLRTIYLGLLPLSLAPLIDTVFIAGGNTRVPMALQALAVTSNVVLNRLLIYGVGDLEGMGIQGAALATCIARGLAVVLGLVLLRTLYGVRLLPRRRPDARLCREILGTGLPVALSIAFFGAVYWGLLALVLRRIGRDAVAALGIGFNGFESVSFPFFLGIALAGSSLVGRSLGAGRPEDARRAVRSARRIGHVCGLGFTGLFLFAGPRLVPFFTSDPAVLRETIGYVLVLAWSQPFVAEEAVNEKALHGAGDTRAILWISATGNLLRLPLAWLLAMRLELGALGVWWTINATSLVKALWLRRRVGRADWFCSPGAGETPPRRFPRLRAPGDPEDECPPNR